MSNGVTVISDIERYVLPVAGWTVGRVYDHYQDAMGISENSAATVNNRAASFDTILEADQTLVFARPLGQKG
jgi:hypothetical protein